MYWPVHISNTVLVEKVGLMHTTATTFWSWL
jgi:hypothetical protein